MRRGNGSQHPSQMTPSHSHPGPVPSPLSTQTSLLTPSSSPSKVALYGTCHHGLWHVGLFPEPLCLLLLASLHSVTEAAIGLREAKQDREDP